MQLSGRALVVRTDLAEVVEGLYAAQLDLVGREVLLRHIRKQCNHPEGRKFRNDILSM